MLVTEVTELGLSLILSFLTPLQLGPFKVGPTGQFGFARSVATPV